MKSDRKVQAEKKMSASDELRRISDPAGLTQTCFARCVPSSASELVGAGTRGSPEASRRLPRKETRLTFEPERGGRNSLKKPLARCTSFASVS